MLHLGDPITSLQGLLAPSRLQGSYPVHVRKTTHKDSLRVQFGAAARDCCLAETFFSLTKRKRDYPESPEQPA